MSEFLDRKFTEAFGGCVLAGILALGLYLFSELSRHPQKLFITGHAVVVDGDTIDVAGERVRLAGIDAPELKQGCRKQWQSQACVAGKTAKFQLIRLIAGRITRCEIHGTGKYNRLIGTCYVGDVELNAEMVRRGMAWAFRKYSQSYVALEEATKRRRIGIWR